MYGTVVDDTFTRTSSSGWGTADTGQAWSTFGSGGSVVATDWTVGSGAGAMSVPVAGGKRFAYLAGVSEADVDVTVTGSSAVTPTGGLLVLVDLLTRLTSTSSYYQFQVLVAVGGAVNASVTAPGGAPLRSVTIPALTYTAGMPLTVRAQSIGRIHRLKVWTGTEPPNWQIEVIDSTYTGAGAIGAGCETAATNTNTTPVVFSFDDFASTLIASFPTDPLPVVVLAAFGADLTATPNSWAWTDITGDVRQAGGGKITISPMGRSDEASAAQPAGCTFELANDSGNYSKGPGRAHYPDIRRNTPIQVQVGPSTRFFGYATGWTPSWADASCTVPIVTVSASGILRRLLQGKTLLRSALYRATSTDSHIKAYWPLEGGTGLTVAPSGLSGGQAAAYTAVSFGKGTGLPGSEALPTVTGTSTISMPFTATFTGHWTASWYFNIATCPTVEQATLFRIDVPTGTATFWLFVMGTDTVLGTYCGLSALASGPILGSEQVVPVPAFTLGAWVHANLQVTQVGGNVDFSLTLAPFDGDPVADGVTMTNSFAGVIGTPTQMRIIADPGRPDMSVGHAAMFDSSGLPSAPTIANAWAPAGTVSETAVERITRLCLEEGVPFTITGTSDTVMGAQGVDTFLNLLRECEAADLGVLFDGRTQGLGYLTRAARYNIPAILTADAAADQVAPPFAPVDDDQRNRNVVTVGRKNGGNVTVEDTTGPLGTDTIGVYDSSVTVNVSADDPLPDIAAWLVGVGTVDEPYRYPGLHLDLGAAPALQADWLATGVGGRIDVTNIDTPASTLPAGDIELLLEGYSEVLSPFDWTVSAACSPYRPNEVQQVEDPVWGRIDTGGQVLAADAAVGATSLSVSTTSGPLATTTATFPADFPFDIDVAGWQVTVTAISGTSSPQTFTTDPIPAAVHTGDTVHGWKLGVIAL